MSTAKVQLVNKAFTAFMDKKRSMHFKLRFIVREAPIGNWINIEFQDLDVTEMEAIAEFIRLYYKRTDKKPFFFLSPKMIVDQSGYLSLTLDGSDVEEVFKTVLS